MAQIDILLGIFAIKSKVVHGFTEVRQARHAGVFVGNIQSTGVACIPICILFMTLE
jgi:hypothetical protein